MQEVIKKEILEIERRENVKILYACESGSRAWGFPSRDSDYDVRFIYIRPKEWYLSIDDYKDTLDFPINDLLDISGWDIRKALKLFRSSNAVIFEWLQSPIIYKEEPAFKEQLIDLLKDYYSLRAGMHHYLGMTINPFKNDLQSDTVKIKKYLYALRSSLACRWMREKQTVPPMEFGILRTLIKDEGAVNELVDQLLVRKKDNSEGDTIPSSRLLNQFIENEIRESELYTTQLEKSTGSTEVLNNIFRNLLSKSFKQEV
ncbi:putative nucleotidyltransferase [Sporocytophaga myxococcoides]|uniref:Putative nucleotidyltransferase n=1 Tax=Sporocytophaga myxococcoides TaxID=153721 RepID=A0A098LDY9_9BACT|nr:nucleotidyltransferase domain-containing protein [Sporocytophaga myxococcoides]GAL84298.1 putative nucleotidyltransferase [Sporocytophaga myxococcoides]